MQWRQSINYTTPFLRYNEKFELPHTKKYIRPVFIFAPFALVFGPVVIITTMEIEFKLIIVFIFIQLSSVGVGHKVCPLEENHIELYWYLENTVRLIELSKKIIMLIAFLSWLSTKNNQGVSKFPHSTDLRQWNQLRQRIWYSSKNLPPILTRGTKEID